MQMWQLRLLAEHVTGIEADELLGLAPLPLLPYMKPGERRQYMRNLEIQARSLRLPPGAPEPLEVIEHNPDLAAQWFAAQGIKVH